MIAHQEQLALQISCQQGAAFAMTPQRILDYFPGGVGCGTFTPGQAIYCYNTAVVSLLELIAVDEDDLGSILLSIKVTTAPFSQVPLSAQEIKTASFFSMIEDWQFEALSNGSLLTKTWRDISVEGDAMEMAAIVRDSAITESQQLISRWNKAGLAE
ncbi:hypothetical protein [Oceanicoccus sp. KOV_DT_Chl]|uniref:hypothetical protein n=1 Tax=Oceanicoccus sp. KOV_DT_Chl TaxID=1904639 RepID=UPI000C7CA6AA|nr:hypothetical protein [Oceanicoccus sp. KOV_DT_Chl]